MGMIAVLPPLIRALSLWDSGCECYVALGCALSGSNIYNRELDRGGWYSARGDLGVGEHSLHMCSDRGQPEATDRGPVLDMGTLALLFLDVLCMVSRAGSW